MDSFTAALGRLDPASRALLDLSLRRGMTPDQIGELLGTDADSVVAAREGALEQLATELDMEDSSQLDEVRTRLAELPAEAWTGTAAAADRPRLEVVRDAPAEPPAARRRSRLPLLLTLLAVAAVALVIVLASGGGDEKTASSTPRASAPAPSQPSRPAQPAKKPKPAQPAVKETKLIALGTASGATGTAALTQGGRRLTLKASGLAPGDYQVWLYNSVIDAVSLTKVQGTSMTLDLKLPANASHYRYVDVSREPADGNPNHSGESVLRVRLSKLSR